MDKFLLAENPLRPDSSGPFIIHMLDPVAIITCDEDHVQFPPGKLYKHFSFQNTDNIIEHWTLYRSYLEWEDKQIEDENE